MKEYSLILSVLVFLFGMLLVQLTFTSKEVSFQECLVSLLLHLTTSIVVLTFCNHGSTEGQDTPDKSRASWITQMLFSTLNTQKKIKKFSKRKGDARRKGRRMSKKYQKGRKSNKKQEQYGIRNLFPGAFSTIWCFFNKGNKSVPGSSSGNSSDGTNNPSPGQDVSLGQSLQANSSSSMPTGSTENDTEQGGHSQGQSPQSNSSSSMVTGSTGNGTEQSSHSQGQRPQSNTLSSMPATSTDNDQERSSDSQTSGFKENPQDLEKQRSGNPQHASVRNSKRGSESETPGPSSMAMPQNRPRRKKPQTARDRETLNHLDSTPPSPLPSPSADVQITNLFEPPVHSVDDMNEVASRRSAEQIPMPARRVDNTLLQNNPFPRQVQSEIVVPNVRAFDDRRRNHHACSHLNCQTDLTGHRLEFCVSCSSAFCPRHASNHQNCRVCVICHSQTPVDSSEFCVSCRRLVCPSCSSLPHNCRVMLCPVTGRSHVLQSVGEPPRCPVCRFPLCPGCAECHRCGVGPPRTF